jgi:hypothetical protein
MWVGCIAMFHTYLLHNLVVRQKSLQGRWQLQHGCCKCKNCLVHQFLSMPHQAHHIQTCIA